MSKQRHDGKRTNGAKVRDREIKRRRKAKHGMRFA